MFVAFFFQIEIIHKKIKKKVQIEIVYSEACKIKTENQIKCIWKKNICHLQTICLPLFLFRIIRGSCGILKGGDVVVVLICCMCVPFSRQISVLSCCICLHEMRCASCTYHFSLCVCVFNEIYSSLFFRFFTVLMM